MVVRKGPPRGAVARSWTQRGTPARIEDILETAADLLIKDGYAKFSLRKVATVVGVGLATIQYHFSDRQRLLSAAIARVMEDWGRNFMQILDDRSLSVEDRLNALHDRGLRYIEDPKTTPLLFELFAGAQREPYLRKIVRDGYLGLRTMAANLLREIRPELSDAELMAFATLVPALMEGLNIFMQNDDPNRPDGALIRQVLRSEIAGYLGAVQAYNPSTTMRPPRKARRKR